MRIARADLGEEFTSELNLCANLNLECLIKAQEMRQTCRDTLIEVLNHVKKRLPGADANLLRVAKTEHVYDQGQMLSIAIEKQLGRKGGVGVTPKQDPSFVLLDII